MIRDMRHVGGLLVLSLFCMAGPAAGQERVVIRGMPRSMTQASADSSARTMITDSVESMLLVVARDGHYYWASRGDRDLVRIRSGLFDMYVDPRGGGYVRVLDQRELADELKIEGPPIQYYEHLTFYLAPFTYWGAAQRYDP